MAILSTIEDIKKHVSVMKSFPFEAIEPYITMAVDQYTARYVGDLHVVLADEAIGVDAVVLNKARYYLQSALTNFAFYLYFPVGSVQIDSSGPASSVNEKRQPVGWQQQNDIRRGAIHYRAGVETKRHRW